MSELESVTHSLPAYPRSLLAWQSLNSDQSAKGGQTQLLLKKLSQLGLHYKPRDSPWLISYGDDHCFTL